MILVCPSIAAVHNRLEAFVGMLKRVEIAGTAQSVDIAGTEPPRSLNLLLGEVFTVTVIGIVIGPQVYIKIVKIGIHLGAQVGLAKFSTTPIRAIIIVLGSMIVGLGKPREKGAIRCAKFVGGHPGRKDAQCRQLVLQHLEPDEKLQDVRAVQTIDTVDTDDARLQPFEGLTAAGTRI